MAQLNPESKVINPELLLAAAILARPGVDWCRPISPGHPDYNDGQDTEADYVAYFDYDGPEDLEIRFDPINSPADCTALREALERAGWSFKYHDAADSFTAEKKMELVPDLWIVEKTPALRDLACVSAQTGIKMYGEAG